jgi:hypothetical protein
MASVKDEAPVKIRMKFNIPYMLNKCDIAAKYPK